MVSTSEQTEFLSRLIQLSQLRLERERPLHAVPKKPDRYAYATAAKGYGFNMAMMGFDFTDLENQRRKFQWWLEQQGVDQVTAHSEAMRLEHSWEFAAYSQGKVFMAMLDPWTGALDLTPGSVGLKLYDHYVAVRNGHAHKHSAAESRTDFASLKEIFNSADKATQILRGILKETRDATTALIQRQNASGITAEFAQSLRIRTGADFSKNIENYLMRVWRESRDLALDELPKALRDNLAYLKRYDAHAYASAFRPDVAGNYFHNRALMVSGLVDDELTKQAKFIIFKFLKEGKTINETIGELQDVFQPWIGTPAIEPSGISQTPEDILKPYRLETILRTESADAISESRRAVGDAAEDAVSGYELSPIIDDRTSETCLFIADNEPLTFRKTDPRAIKLFPPLHWSCRTIPIFVMTGDDVEWTDESTLDELLRLVPKEFK